jgi:hypothetical protein
MRRSTVTPASNGFGPLSPDPDLGSNNCNGGGLATRPGIIFRTMVCSGLTFEVQDEVRAQPNPS